MTTSMASGGLSPRVPVSVGELLDKITILEIKAGRIQDPRKRANVLAELDALQAVHGDLGITAPNFVELRERLASVNLALWEIEDAIRECERRADFGPTFVRLARSVYRTNDERAMLKRVINELAGSSPVEEKSYVAYGAAAS